MSRLPARLPLDLDSYHDLLGFSQSTCSTQQLTQRSLPVPAGVSSAVSRLHPIAEQPQLQPPLHLPLLGLLRLFRLLFRCRSTSPLTCNSPADTLPQMALHMVTDSEHPAGPRVWHELDLGKAPMNALHNRSTHPEGRSTMRHNNCTTLFLPLWPRPLRLHLIWASTADKAKNNKAFQVSIKASRGNIRAVYSAANAARE
jgi:hypothetical protein